MHVETRFVPAFLIGGREIRTHGNRGDLAILAPYFRDEIVTILVGQTDIAQDHVHIILLEKLEAALRRIGGSNIMSPASQDRRESALGVGMVLDQ
jgi:hypothetical protein